jgi:hypothetical protein
MVCLGASAPAEAQVEKQKILDAVRASFDAYEQIPCVGLEFEYAGDPPALLTEEPGAIVIYFGATEDVWTLGDLAWTTKAITGNAQNHISKAWIGFNAKDWWWSLADPADGDKLDIQSALLELIPITLGYYVGPDAKTSVFDISLGAVDRSLDDLKRLGAQALYWNAEANGCSAERPADPVACQNVSVPDAGVADASAADAGDAGAAAVEPFVCLLQRGGTEFYRWKDTPIKYYVYVPEDGKLPGGTGGNGGQPGADAGVSTGDGGFVGCTSDSQCDDGQVCSSQGICVAQSGGDDGCCRFAHTREENLAYGALISLLLVVFVRRLRRRARS